MSNYVLFRRKWKGELPPSGGVESCELYRLCIRRDKHIVNWRARTHSAVNNVHWLVTTACRLSRRKNAEPEELRKFYSWGNYRFHFRQKKTSAFSYDDGFVWPLFRLQ